jgi:hypothetical protein
VTASAREDRRLEQGIARGPGGRQAPQSIRKAA